MERGETELNPPIATSVGGASLGGLEGLDADTAAQWMAYWDERRQTSQLIAGRLLQEFGKEAAGIRDDPRPVIEHVTLETGMPINTVESVICGLQASGRIEWTIDGFRPVRNE